LPCAEPHLDRVNPIMQWDGLQLEGAELQLEGAELQLECAVPKLHRDASQVRPAGRKQLCELAHLQLAGS
jgi:hypothetical protein